MLILWLFNHKNIFNEKFQIDPRLSIFAVIFIYYYSFEGSIDVRFALGYNIFILSWCLSYLWQCLEESQWKWSKHVGLIMICVLLLMSIASYSDGIRGPKYVMRILSPLTIQKAIFPRQYTPVMRILS